jgi:hypothetical protein
LISFKVATASKALSTIQLMASTMLLEAPHKAAIQAVLKEVDGSREAMMEVSTETNEHLLFLVY